jgi:hypothetical protein
MGENKMVKIVWKLFERFLDWVDKIHIPPFPSNDEFADMDWASGYIR